MSIYRLFTGTGGHSYLEKLNLESTAELTVSMPAKGIKFQQSPAHHFVDWHPAPQRQYVIILSGHLEIGLSDGSFHRFGPGDARLVEDTTGKGHTTRVVGDSPVITAVVPLAD